jgi:hypothetical protein
LQRFELLHISCAIDLEHPEQRGERFG